MYKWNLSRTPIDCGDNNPCTTDSCFNGTCTYQFSNNTCNDSNECTLNDHCVNGICIGTLMSCNDNNVCTDDVCDCITGNCFYGFNTDTCDDGNICTAMDTCSNGVCVGMALFCDDQNPCTTDTCDTQTGMCTFTNNMISCNDTDPCTENDVCSNGACSGTPKSCDDQNVCTLDSCNSTTGLCETNNIIAVCNDGNPCTINDLCDINTGLCAGVPKICDDLNPCTTDSCDNSSGICINTDNTDCCNDGDICTVEDTCNMGVCVGVAVDCDDNNVCTHDTCDNSTGLCLNVPNSNPCDDLDPCTSGDICFNGTCVGQQSNCDDANSCTDDMCDQLSGNCTNIINNTNNCTDNDLCTVNDQCMNGLCMGTPINCNDNNPCTNDICMNGECMHTFITNSSCSDSNPCTLNDTCIQGFCIGTPIVCEDNNTCTDDFCSNGTCQFLPCNTFRPCDDGMPCTQNDVCVNDTCVGTLIQCEDGNFCNGIEFCNTTSGSCLPGTPPTCDDGLFCTQNICDNMGGMCQNPGVSGNGTQCGITDVGVCEFGILLCQESSSNSTFTNLTCIGNVDPIMEICNDTLDNDCDGLIDEGCGTVCETVDDCPTMICNDVICNQTTNICEYEHNTEFCNDQNLCTRNDQCIDGICAGIPLVCDDDEICTQDSCNITTGFCMNIPIIVPCDDLDLCTVNDHCENGTCVGTPFICDDNNNCTSDACIEMNGVAMCFTKPDNNSTCDDGNPCSLNDRCENGVCISDDMNCDDNNNCTDDLCISGVCMYTNNTNMCDDNNLCTIGDICADGNCTGTPKNCADGNLCTFDFCNGTTGLCVNTATINSLCDDLDPCTISDACDSNGTCTGIPKDCDDSNTCTNDFCNETNGICNNENNNSPCDDLDPCTFNDTCSNGVCNGQSIICNDDNNCTTDRCFNGSCCFDPISIPCDDNDNCTMNDMCVQMMCVGTQIDCSDSNECTMDECMSPGGTCRNLAITGLDCDDMNICTFNDSCFNGACQGIPTNCTSLDEECKIGVCNTINGMCQTMNVADGTSCSDMNLCTENDTCTNGICQGSLIDCSTGNICATGNCNITTGLCDSVNNNFPCDDLNPCTIDDRCNNSICVGTPKDCNDGNICTNNTCNPNNGICEAANNMVPCDDLNPCTIQDMCISGICMGMPNTCSDNNPCTDDSCNKFTGLCENVNNNNNPCKHPDLCIVDDMCFNGTCVGIQKDCTDNNPCTGSVCNSQTGNCESINQNVTCDDNDPCTLNDVCVNGTCSGTQMDCDDSNDCTNDFCFNGMCFNVGNQNTCDDGNPCTDDFCNETLKMCIGTNNNQNQCDDGDNCTISDSCVNGTCIGTPVNCNDNNTCTVDTCSPINGTCMNTDLPVNSTCNDGDFCTEQDSCIFDISGGGILCKGIDIDCDDGNNCTFNECSPLNGTCLITNLDGILCNDNNECTQNDTCDNGICFGIGVDCNPNTQCANYTCNHYTGNCDIMHIIGSCDDGLECTENDTCINGECVGITKNCNDGNICTTNLCNITTGECYSVNNNLPCDDNNMCTTGDTCINGNCTGTEVVCDQDTQCTNHTCNKHTGFCETDFLIGNCSDNNHCTENDTCINGLCLGVIKTCGDDNICTTNICNTTNGECITTNNALQCDDGLMCTFNDICSNGTCSGTPVICDLSTNCLNHTCNHHTGNCEFNFIVGPCDDLDNCTENDFCINGLCQGTPKDCDDGNICSSTQCDTMTGNCVAINNNQSCDDSNACTSNDLCINGECIGTPKECNGTTECVNHTCNIITGMCEFKLLLGDCTDGDNCTENDTCINGICTGIPKNCNDGNICSTDECNPMTGNCIETNNNQQCDDNDMCTISDVCVNGTCQGTPIICNETTQCKNHTCNKHTGMCEFIFLIQSCNGSNLCTENNTCINGECIGEMKNCDDTNICTTDFCNITNGMCVSVNNTLSCDDGLLCTENDTCIDGICIGTPVICDLDTQCSNHTCNPLTGLCETSLIIGNCSDNNNCTENDTCTNGECIGVNKECDDMNSCTTNFCNITNGECVTTNNTSPCNDLDMCTQNDMCIGGICQGTPVICNPNTECTNNTCNKHTGDCEMIILSGNCTDGDFCTINDVCTNGVCIGEQKICDDNNPCTNDMCNITNGECIFTDNNSPCNDGNLCTENDFCFNGTCQGISIICNQTTQCMNHTCNHYSGMCEFIHLIGPCDDGDLCTLDDKCINGECIGTPQICPIGFCGTGVCNTTTGLCMSLSEGSPCDDGNICSENDICMNGECIGVPVDCNDNNTCTDDVCVDMQNNSSMCFHKYNSNQCNDGDMCTHQDVCSNGQCIGIPMNCSDGNVCTDDFCNPSTGLCEFNFNHVPCSDNDACTIDDKCKHGSCIGTPKICDGDMNPCTNDTCIHGICVFIPFNNGSPCNITSNLCLKDSICMSGQCLGGMVLDCNDNNTCTDDTCNPQTGICDILNNNMPCDDNNICTETDICVNGNCTGTHIDCDDFNSCTIDSCDPILGCMNVMAPNGSQCDDGQGCTENDVCLNGQCIPGPEKNCNDSNPCTSNECDYNIGDCRIIHNNDPCDDLDECTLNDICNYGICMGQIIVCDDGNQCTDNECVMGNCVFSPSNIGTLCNITDDLCKIDTACDGNGNCIGVPVICENTNPCTRSYCHPDTGECVEENLQGLCDDGDSCSINDTCIEHHGISECIGIPIVCDDFNECTKDICANGMCFYKDLNGNICDDNSMCTVNDTCIKGTCKGSLAINCGDGTPCADIMCDPLTGNCVVAPVDRPCDDGDECTINEYCSYGECISDENLECEDNNDCTNDWCDSNSGGCIFEPKDDHEQCSVHEDQHELHGFCFYGHCQIKNVTQDTSPIPTPPSSPKDHSHHKIDHNVLIITLICICVVLLIIIVLFGLWYFKSNNSYENCDIIQPHSYKQMQLNQQQPYQQNYENNQSYDQQNYENNQSYDQQNYVNNQSYDQQQPQYNIPGYNDENMYTKNIRQRQQNVNNSNQNVQNGDFTFMPQNQKELKFT